MDGLSGIPTYSEDSQNEKFQKGLIAAWPRVYRFISGFIYFILKTIRDNVMSAISQIFH